MNNQSIQIISEDRLKTIIREIVKEVIEEEFIKLRLALIPYISDEEQREIEELYGKPDEEIVRTIILEE